jgi:predicted RNA-binding protein with RPS1 domain
MYKKNDIINVIVTSIKEYGVFVKTDTNYTGLIHISEINGDYIKDINKYFNIKSEIKARIIDIDDSNKHLSLSTRGLLNNNDKSKKNYLKEVGEGFDILKNELPKWIDVTKKEIEKEK